MTSARLLVAACFAATLTTACSGPREPADDPVAEMARRDLPGLRRARIIDLGQQVFAAHCATCHGEQGRGDGQNASRLQPRPPDLAGAVTREGIDHVRRVIRDGSASVGRSPLCPPRARQLGADHIDALTAYVEWLARAAP
jgi:mono/diheme cytochrome c family protein